MGIFLVSPRNGNAVVSWHRSRISVRPRNGFRPNTAYRITMLPGLGGSARKRPEGLAHDSLLDRTDVSRLQHHWPCVRLGGGASGGQRIHRGDLARRHDHRLFGRDRHLGPIRRRAVAAGEYLVRALIDQNSNRTLDRNEKWDSVARERRQRAAGRRARRDRARFDAAALSEHHRRSTASQLRITFDKPLDPFLALQPALIRLQKRGFFAAGGRAASSGKEPTIRRRRRAQQVADSLRRAADYRSRPAARPTPPPAPDADARRGRCDAPPPPPKPRLPAPDRGIVVTVSPTTPLRPGHLRRHRARHAQPPRSREGHDAHVYRHAGPRCPTRPQRARADSARRPPAVPPTARLA